MTGSQVTTLDLAVLVGYILGTRLLFGYLASRRVSAGSAESYFLAGRDLRWPILGLSFYVANMSGSTFIGLPGSGYNDGVAVYNYEWIAAVILVFFLLFFLPLYVRARVYTAPEFLEARFDRRSRLAFSGFLLLANIFIDAAAALYAGGMIVAVLFPQVPVWVTAAVASALAGVYILFGGLRAVVINDVLQAVMIFAGASVVAVLTYLQIPSWAEARAAVPPEALHLARPADDSLLPWPGMLTGVLVVGIYFWCTNQFMIQRALGARSLDEGRWGALFAGLLKLPNLFILVLPGVMAVSLYPDLERPDLVFPTLVFDLLPAGLRGLLLAAMAAAILSSLEAILNSASTLFTMDFVRAWRPRASERVLVRSGRWATLGFMVAAAAWAPQITHWPTLWHYLQSVLAYITPPVVAVFLGGILWKRANAHGAFATLCIGVPLGLAGWVCNEIRGDAPIQFLYASGIMLVLSATILAGVSLLGAPPDPDSAGHAWSRELWVQNSEGLGGKPWYLDFRWQALALMLLTAVLVGFWI